MTQDFLITRCFFRIKDCENCPDTEWCKKYMEKFGNDPYEDEEIHPERYVNIEL